MLVLPSRLLYWVLCTSDQCFCFFPAKFMSSTYTDKNIPFWRWTKKHSRLETFSQPCFNKIFSNCLSHNSPAKGWPYRFLSRGTTGSSILDHDLGHLCRGRRIQMSGHSDLAIFKNFGASSIFTWVSADTASVLRNPAVWRWYPWLLLLSFEMPMNLVQWNLREALNRLLQYHLRVQLDLCILGALPPIQHFSSDMCPLMMQYELLRPTSLLHRSPLSYFWLSSNSTPKFSPSFSHSLSTAAFAAGTFIAWGIGINLWTKLLCCSELSPFPAIWSSWWFGIDSPIRSLVDSLASRIHASFVLILLDPPLPQFFFIILQA